MAKQRRHRQVLNRTLCAGALLSIAVLAPGSTMAQEEAPLPTRSQDYLRDVITLAGTLGSAHGVRYVCYGDSDQYWRQHMVDLLSLEAPERSSLRDSMVTAFNDRFTRVRNQYNRCTDRVLDAEAEYAAQGRDLANKLAASYFPRAGR